MISFDDNRWDYIKRRHEGWWKRTNMSPLIGFAIPKGNVPSVPLTQANCHDLSKSAVELADEIEAYLGAFEYYGDAFPYYNMDSFGPGVLAAILGARLDNSTGRVWFHPVEVVDIKDLRFEFDPKNMWFQRIRDICRTCTDRLDGRAILSMPDLGGILDILSTFRPGELLLYDLYDEPDEVLRLIKELEDIWYRAYDELSGALRCKQHGYTDWSGIWSAESSYITQCDFSYMIGPDMFETFAYDTLKRDCEQLSRVIYHLDGPRQLCHVDNLLAIDKLDCIQWIPGAGNPDIEHYPDLYRKITDADKLIHTNSQSLTAISALCEQVSNPRSVACTAFTIPLKQKQEALDFLAKFK